MIPAINLYLLAVVSCVITWVLYIPFINFLYKVNFKDPFRKKGRLDRFGDTVDVFDQIKGSKSGTPSGGGILVITVTALTFIIVGVLGSYKFVQSEFLLLITALLAYGIAGLIDDLTKHDGKALRVRYKLLIQIIISLLISYVGISNGLFYVAIPFLGVVINNGPVLYVLSVLTLTFMSNAFNIVDGIDGLASGLLLITLAVLAVLIGATGGSITQLVFVFIIFGAVLAFLYFNVNPARLFMGDSGALAFGVIIGVLTLTTGTLYILPLVGFIYIMDACTSLIQWTSKYFRNGKKVFKIAPVHHHFEAVGWEGTKVVFRFWIIHLFFSLLGLGVFFWAM